MLYMAVAIIYEKLFYSSCSFFFLKKLFLHASGVTRYIEVIMVIVMLSKKMICLFTCRWALFIHVIALFSRDDD